MKNNPNLKIEVYLVPYGYQVDFYDQSGNLRISTARDFASDYPIKLLEDQIELHILQSLDKFREGLPISPN